MAEDKKSDKKSEVRQWEQMANINPVRKIEGMKRDSMKPRKTKGR